MVIPAQLPGHGIVFGSVFLSSFAILTDMKYLLAAVLAVVSVIALCAVPQAGTDARARELIQTLHLSVLPKESGYLGIIGRSAQMVTVDGRALAVQSQNYYMLTRDRPINYLHWLVPDDTDILINGCPLDDLILQPIGRPVSITHGADPSSWP